jgi:hypothetical protein
MVIVAGTYTYHSFFKSYTAEILHTKEMWLFKRVLGINVSSDITRRVALRF